jgi:hypothetical protein
MYRRRQAVVMLGVAIFTAPVPLLAETITLTCALTKVCETGADCTDLPLPMGLKLAESGDTALMTQDGEEVEFRLAAVPGGSDAVRSYAGSGDQDRAAILVTRWTDGTFLIASLDLQDPAKLPAVLIGTCDEAVR